MILNSFKNEIYFFKRVIPSDFLVDFQNITFSHINVKKIASAFTCENGRLGQMIKSEFRALCEP